MAFRSTVILFVACALAAAGCGGDLEGSPTSVVVTRDYGAKVVSAPEQVPAGRGLTVMRQLERTHTVATAYGGRYVKAIDALEEDADSSWLFYVDGVEAIEGASSVRLRPGQSVQWDFHAWQNIRGGGAIIGAYPKPLRSSGTRLICAPTDSDACALARRNLVAAGVEIDAAAPTRVVVGTWSDIAGFDGVPDLAESGEGNGAFAQFIRGGERLRTFSADGSPGRTLNAGAGLLAAFAPSGKNVVWVVTGTDSAGVEEAARLLGQDADAIKYRFAVAVSSRGPIALPEGAE